MSSDVLNAKSESKRTTTNGKIVRCKDCMNGKDLGDEYVECAFYGKIHKTNSCTRRVRKE